MEIQLLSEDSLNSLIGLVTELWPEEDVVEAYENYKAILTSGQEACYLVRQGEQYVAFIHVTIRNDYVEGANSWPIAYVEGVYVKPDFQKQGIASKLISVAEAWAREKGIKQLASDAELTNVQSINFHKQVGFTEAGKIVCFIKNL